MKIKNRRIGKECKKMLFIIFSLGFLFAFSFVFFSGKYASALYTASDNVTINITVYPVAMVDINPTNLTWLNIPPGGVGDSSNEANNYTGIWIENIGSVNIIKAWLYASYPAKYPFGSGNPAIYDPSNMVAVSLTPNGPFQFVNRVEYLDSFYIPSFYIKNDSMFWGRFRNASYEYFFEIKPPATTPTNCSATGTVIEIGEIPHTQTQLGFVDFANGCTPPACESFTVNKNISYTGTQFPDTIYGLANVSINGEWYFVAVASNCTYVIFGKYDGDIPGASYAGNNITYMVTSSNPLLPGAVAEAYARAYVPYGVPSGGNIGAATKRMIWVYVEAA